MTSYIYFGNERNICTKIKTKRKHLTKLAMVHNFAHRIYPTILEQ